MADHAVSTTPSRILRPTELPSKDRGNGARTTPLVTAARGATTYLNGITEFAPGAAIGHHVHNVAESVLIVRGDAVVDVDGVETPLTTLDATFVPANVPHRFRNASDTLPMAIFWTYGSLDSTRTMVASGEHGRIDAEHAGGGAEPVRLVREVAILEAKEGHEAALEAAVATAAPLFQASAGARTLELEQSVEHPRRYRLVVGWERIEDHVDGFRTSDRFPQWRALVMEHLVAPPAVEHVRHVLTAF